MTIFAVFLLGLLGGLHCAGMCGGFVAAMTFRPPMPQSPPATGVINIQAVAMGNTATTTQSTAVTATGPDTRPLFINAGRILSYTMIGAAAGAAGSTAWVLENVLPVQRSLFFLSSALMLLIGVWLLGLRQPLVFAERIGQRFWRHLQPFAARRFNARRPGELLMAGAVWGFVPCGMVYMVLLAALSAGNPLDGAMLMAAFGLGTLPNLLLIGAGSQWLSRLGGATGIRRVIASIIIVLGFVGLFRALSAQPLDPSIFCVVPGGLL
ncbi:MAG: sulfite exporter TauE/SafE family protein [Burkholderiaceae bacterium]